MALFGGPSGGNYHRVNIHDGYLLQHAGRLWRIETTRRPTATEVFASIRSSRNQWSYISTPQRSVRLYLLSSFADDRWMTKAVAVNRIRSAAEHSACAFGQHQFIISPTGARRWHRQRRVVFWRVRRGVQASVDAIRNYDSTKLVNDRLGGKQPFHVSSFRKCSALKLNKLKTTFDVP